MVSSLPTTKCSPGRNGGERGSHKQGHLEGHGRWGSSTLIPRFLQQAGESQEKGAAPPCWCHKLQKREAVVIRCPTDRREKCPGPSRRTPSWLPKSHHLLRSHPRGCFPALLSSAAVSVSCSARLPEPGSTGKTQGMAPGWTPRAADSSPKAPPNTRTLVLTSRPCRHAQQESSYKPGWARLCQPPR